MKAGFLFLTDQGEKIDELTYDCEMLPRIGEEVLTAPDSTPSGTPEVKPPHPPGLWLVTNVTYLLDNHGKLRAPTVTLKHKSGPQSVEFAISF